MSLTEQHSACAPGEVGGGVVWPVPIKGLFKYLSNKVFKLSPGCSYGGWRSWEAALWTVGRHWVTRRIKADTKKLLAMSRTQQHTQKSLFQSGTKGVRADTWARDPGRVSASADTWLVPQDHRSQTDRKKHNRTFLHTHRDRHRRTHTCTGAHNTA